MAWHGYRAGTRRQHIPPFQELIVSVSIENLALNLNYKGTRDAASTNEFEPILATLLQQALESYDVVSDQIEGSIEHINIDFPVINMDEFLAEQPSLKGSTKELREKAFAQWMRSRQKKGKA